MGEVHAIETVDDESRRMVLDALEEIRADVEAGEVVGMVVVTVVGAPPARTGDGYSLRAARAGLVLCEAVYMLEEGKRLLTRELEA